MKSKLDKELKKQNILDIFQYECDPKIDLRDITYDLNGYHAIDYYDDNSIKMSNNGLFCFITSCNADKGYIASVYNTIFYIDLKNKVYLLVGGNDILTIESKYFIKYKDDLLSRKTLLVGRSMGSLAKSNWNNVHISENYHAFTSDTQELENGDYLTILIPNASIIKDINIIFKDKYERTIEYIIDNYKFTATEYAPTYKVLELYVKHWINCSDLDLEIKSKILNQVKDIKDFNI